MRRTVIATVAEHPNGGLLPCLFCSDKSGTVDEAVSRTLLDLVAELDPMDFPILLEMIAAAEKGTQGSDTSPECDFTCNHIEVWLRPPTVNHGQIAIRNTTYGGEAQKFQVHLFTSIWKHWRDFQRKLQGEGKAALMNHRFEMTVDLAE
jgi:hypothetical protein